MTATGLAIASKRDDGSSALTGPCDVFLYGYFGFGNTGDTLLLHAATAAIARRWPEARFMVRNLGPVPLPEALAGRIVLSDVDRALQPSTRGASRGRMRRALSYVRAVASAMSGCRVFVLAGGTLLHVRSSYRPLVLMLLLVAAARLKGLRVVAIGLGARGFDRPLARAPLAIVASLMDDIALRDEESAAAFPASRRVRVCADLVYGWWPADLRQGCAVRPAPDRPPLLTVSLAAPWPPERFEQAGIDEKLAACLAQLAQEGWRMRFIVFQDGSPEQGGLTDRTAIGRVRARLEGLASEADVVATTHDPRQLAACYAESTVHLGARFHGLVLASLMRVPFVGLAIDPKIDSLAGTFGMPLVDPARDPPMAIADAVHKAATLAIDERTVAELAVRAEQNYLWFEGARPVTTKRVHLGA